MSSSHDERICLPDSLVDTLNEHDSSPDDFDEADPSFAIEHQAKTCEDLTDDHRKALFAEVAALQVDLLFGQQRSHWQTRFCPILESIAEDGSRRCCPDITQIDDSAVEYLERRASESKHPVLRARYADFLWDITKVATGNRPSIDLARQAIDSYVECGTRFPNSDQTSERLCRALELALSVRDDIRSSQVIDTMLGILDRTEFPGSQVLWLFDTLTEQRGVSLSPDQEKKLVDTLEAELARICSSENAVGIVAKDPAVCLARHYKRAGKPDEAKRVIRTYGTALASFAMKADGLLAMAWLQDAYATYVQFGMKDEAESLQLAAKDKGKDAEDQMVRHSFSVEIPADEIERVLDDLTAGDLESTLSRISINFCPRINELQEQLDDLKKNAKLLSMVSQSTLDNQQVTARVGSVDDDPEGRLMLQMGQNLQFMAGILAHAIDRMRSKYDFSAESMRLFLSQSILFDEARMPLFEHGINAYLADDQITAIHVLVPQIENSLRRLLPVLEIPTNKHRRSDTGVMVEKSLNNILESEAAVTQFFGEDFVLYLRMFLCDPRGQNVRNKLAHGLMQPEQFHRGISDRLLHIMWSLAFEKESNVTMEVGDWTQKTTE
ncbi:MAG: DUF4209 domain-containing protein [Candidatus Nealsonbacteria bacterium]|nr:DUF4209 domain-containing protein [Candidatus Nealsonbacteria bacterium]